MQFISDNPALRSHLESQVDFMNAFSQKSYETLRQVSEMNLKLARQSIEGALHASREMMNCTDPMQLAQTAMKQMQPASERLRTYQQHLMEILAGAQADFTRAAETRLPQASRSASAVAEEMVRQASAAANVPVTAKSTPGNGGADTPPQHH